MGEDFLLSGAYAPLIYLKCIFDIFENIKKIETKMFCVHVHVLRAYKIVSTKIDILYGLCKNEKIWY
jgi:hypothetical protein